ncbi:2'-5' RNA ligase family protein [Sporosalibacterium faouarense]|uniref:2'-5' RNA ligase family protein n=1 Tax=Sporosalibacterium faouarense TaxID=516123 RepID=UPI00141CD8BC|nr:2'-5' RNA ligase family protein [Sporosalibacterium faouarense]MTI47934.1 2'-5' RNA ligase family protein [Bacillota bacterium]
MPYSIELYFDKRSTEKIIKIRREFHKQGISIENVGQPHITLAIYEDLDLEKYKEELKAYSQEIKTFDITLSNIGMFVTESPVLFISPIVTKELLNIHSEFHTKFKKHSGSAWEYYIPDNWVPHCTLIMGIENNNINRAIKSCKDLGLPIDATIEGIGILEFSPNKQIVKYKLK